MNIAITFRHVESTDAIKLYAQEKVGKIQKFLRSPMKANVTLSVEKGQQIAEVLIKAGSEHYTAKETSDSMYASIDRVYDKLSIQVQGNKGSKIAAIRGGMTAGEFAQAAATGSGKE